MENNIDISKLDVKELKALAYDFISQREQAENNLRQINLEISVRLKFIPLASSNKEDKKIIP